MMSTPNMLNSFKQIIAQVGVVTIGAIGSLAVAYPVQAAKLDLGSWSSFGDVVSTSSQARLTNAVNPATGFGDDDFIGIEPINRNISGRNPLYLPTEPLEPYLTLSQGALGLDAKEGSAIQTVLNVMAGDKFSFDWNFTTFDSLNIDRAFVAINNVVNKLVDNKASTLTGSNPFSYTFTGAGSYRIAIGVVDVNDAFSSSILTVSNANIAAVPTPAILPGLIALGLGARAKRRRTSN
jgi:hypothetical protein